ncbi:hypothetical protein NQ318_002968 [Aromia moschata]|uniref:Uncharacterized protein n=1 Tax=Aromia moschata TaxID=1265417 RepID=A0AAV8YRB4_9CUCU|nr:hypothetical protein NQ318_002968 [Aromia moschata]
MNRSTRAKMVPKLLTPEQKESRMNIYADIVNNTDPDPGFLDRVTLKGTRFESMEAVKAEAMEVLNHLTEADFQHCFQQWKSRMERLELQLFAIRRDRRLYGIRSVRSISPVHAAAEVGRRSAGLRRRNMEGRQDGIGQWN